VRCLYALDQANDNPQEDYVGAMDGISLRFSNRGDVFQVLLGEV
jgi:hypothetical protein